VSHYSARSWLAPLALAVLVAASAAVAVSYYRTESEIAKHDPDAKPKTGSPNMMPGIRKPATVPALAAHLPDDEPVIGVTVGERHRAYRVAALAPMISHVVNDVLGDTPVTVTYCNRSDCAEVFTADRVGQPLDVWSAGYVDGLMLRMDGQFFMQKTRLPLDGGRQVPLELMKHTRTTWKEWRDAHPDTDVFVGE